MADAAALARLVALEMPVVDVAVAEPFWRRHFNLNPIEILQQSDPVAWDSADRRAQRIRRWQVLLLPPFIFPLPKSPNVRSPTVFRQG